MARFSALLCLAVVSVFAEDVKSDAGAKPADFLSKKVAPVELSAVVPVHAEYQGKEIHNDYKPGVNGKVFETPPPGMNMADAYVGTNMVGIIAGFFFFGIVILITWMECKAWCKTLHIFG